MSEDGEQKSEDGCSATLAYNTAGDASLLQVHGESAVCDMGGNIHGLRRRLSIPSPIVFAGQSRLLI